MTEQDELSKMKSEILETKKKQLLELQDAYRRVLAEFRKLEGKIEKMKGANV